MAAIHDMCCTRCPHVEHNYLLKNPSRLPKCPKCSSGVLEILWSHGSKQIVTVHPKERAVVWVNKKTGSVAYPPANDAPMPARYAGNGYERVEFSNLHSLDSFCASKKLVNEKASFDNSGNADDL